jgi:hypothetical protein
MTKAIRIENADTSDHKVLVQIWERGQKDADGNMPPDTVVQEYTMDFPTSMITTHIYKERYLVITEVDG